MSKSIAVIGTLDTRGEEIGYIKELIEARGHPVIVMDVGVLGEPPFEPDINHRRVAQASGLSLEEVIALGSPESAMNAMALGASNIIRQLHVSRKLGGVLAAGGSMATALALTVMKVLPLGVPKLIVSTIAFSPLISADAVCGDLMMIQWAAGLWGLNSISRRIIRQAAATITAAAEIYDREEDLKQKPTVGVTSVGSSISRYLRFLKPALEERGYEVAVFHPLGMGGRVLEQAVAEGLIDVVFDLSPQELLSLVVGSPCSAGADRMEAAGKRGIPQIVGLGTRLNVFFWPAWMALPRKFRNRSVVSHNSLTTVVASSKEEKAAVGKLIAQKLNKATGPVVVVHATRDFEGGADDKRILPQADSEGKEACATAVRENIKPSIKFVEIDANVNDRAFADKVLELFDEMIQKKRACR